MLTAGRGLVEIRRAVLKPERKTAYLASLGRIQRPGLIAALSCDLGADSNEVIHLIAHAGYGERDERQRATKEVPLERECVLHERSEVFVEALECIAAAGADVRGASAFAPSKAFAAPVYEWREYQLELGYNPIPKLREAFVAGLPSRVASDVEKRGQVAFMGWTDVGHLNRFVEVWRYGSMSEAMAAREAARSSKEWRETIGKVAPMVQSFSTAFYRPAAYSPWQ